MNTSTPIKRKVEDDSFEKREDSKKPNNETGFSLSGIGALSTHLNDDNLENDSKDMSLGDITVVEAVEKSYSNSIQQDNEGREDKKDKKIKSSTQTIDLLQTLLRSKDHLLEHKEVEINFRDNRISNLESLVAEKITSLGY